MNRRDVLGRSGALVAAALAGCTAGSRRPGTGTPADATAAVEVTSVGSFGSGFPVEATVEVVDPWATADRPPAVEVALRNQSSRRLFVVAGDGDWQVLSDRASDRVEPGVALLGEEELARDVAGVRSDTDDVPTPERESDDRSPTPDRNPDGCWKLTDGTRNPLRVRNLTELAPRGTRSMRFEVRGHHRNAAGVCLPAGEFAFSDTYAVESDPDAPAVEWGFSLRVEDLG